MSARITLTKVTKLFPWSPAWIRAKVVNGTLKPGMKMNLSGMIVTVRKIRRSLSEIESAQPGDDIDLDVGFVDRKALLEYCDSDIVLSEGDPKETVVSESAKERRRLELPPEAHGIFFAFIIIMPFVIGATVVLSSFLMAVPPAKVIGVGLIAATLGLAVLEEYNVRKFGLIIIYARYGRNFALKAGTHKGKLLFLRIVYAVLLVLSCLLAYLIYVMD